MRMAVARRNAALDTVTSSAASGVLRVYSGTQPANADTALSGNTLLATLTLSSTAFGAAAGGVLTANTITQDTAADATATATFARLLQSNTTTVIGDLTVSATGGGGEVQFSTTSFVIGVAVTMTSLTITFPAT